VLEQPEQEYNFDHLLDRLFDHRLMYNRFVGEQLVEWHIGSNRFEQELITSLFFYFEM
jgi:hypothetical protein